MLNAIVAVDINNGIGYNNQLLERIPEDLKNFKKLTLNHYVVMGRKTFDSLPGGPLPGRMNIVLSRIDRISPSGSVVYMTLNHFQEWYSTLGPAIPVFIIGGESIYKSFFDQLDNIYLTKIYKIHDKVDTFFPEIKTSLWKEKKASIIKTYNNIHYQFLTYSRL